MIVTGISGILDGKLQPTEQPGHDHVDVRQHLRLEVRQRPHDALHRVLILLQWVVRFVARLPFFEQIREEQLQNGLDIRGGEREFAGGEIARVEDPLDAVGGVSVDDGIFGAQQTDDGGKGFQQDGALQLNAEGDDVFEVIRFQDIMLT